MFKIVKLLTRSGEYVASFRIPDTAIPFDVICWGNRMFSLIGGEYREVCPHYVTGWSEVNEDGTPKLGGQSLHSGS
jgi:hypothetical protein